MSLSRSWPLLTSVYIDGFNLYYRALKDTPFRWLDLRMLAETLFPQDTINRVCYFTALLDARPDNPLQPRRQLVYLRALATLPDLEIHYGRFRSGIKRRPLAQPAPGLPGSMLFRDSEEKGSDVNLATRLLVDGFNGEYEQAVVISNDADFAGAMGYVKDGLGLRVTLVNPDPNNSSPRDLSAAATYVKRLWKSHLRRSQFPDTLTDEVGVIAKPNAW
ncbi:MAG: NYN domain-containing protein [Chloroflexi bacterium]|nr:NYN domain-containing protein [Chloroflexota bacterium]